MGSPTQTANPITPAEPTAPTKSPTQMYSYTINFNIFLSSPEPLKPDPAVNITACNEFVEYFRENIENLLDQDLEPKDGQSDVIITCTDDVCPPCEANSRRRRLDPAVTTEIDYLITQTIGITEGQNATVIEEALKVDVASVLTIESVQQALQTPEAVAAVGEFTVEKIETEVAPGETVTESASPTLAPTDFLTNSPTASPTVSAKSKKSSKKTKSSKSGKSKKSSKKTKSSKTKSKESKNGSSKTKPKKST